MNIDCTTIFITLAMLVPEKHTYGARFVGQALYANINPETVLKASLFRGDSIGYIGLQLEILNKRFGRVDSTVVPFPVYTAENNHSVRKMLMAYTPSDTVQWTPALTTEELAEIHRQVAEYIDVFDALPDMDTATRV